MARRYLGWAWLLTVTVVGCGRDDPARPAIPGLADKAKGGQAAQAVRKSPKSNVELPPSAPVAKADAQAHPLVGLPLPRFPIKAGSDAPDYGRRPFDGPVVVGFAADPAPMIAALRKAAGERGATVVVVSGAAADGGRVTVLPDPDSSLRQRFLVETPTAAFVAHPNGLVVWADTGGTEGLARRLKDGLELARLEPEAAYAKLTVNPSAKRPLPGYQGCFCEADLRRAKQDYLHRLASETYQQAGRRNPAWDRPALALLAAWEADTAGQGDRQELVRATKAMADKGCDDPMVRFAAAAGQRAAGQKVAAYKLVRQALASFGDGPYGPALRWRAAQLATTLEQAEDVKPVKGELDAAAATDPSAKPYSAAEDELESFAVTAAGELGPLEPRIELNDWLATHNDKPIDAARALGKQTLADPWMREVLVGREELLEALESRPRGFGRPGAAAGKDQGADHLGRARDCLVRAWLRHPGYPEPAAAMVSVTSMAEPVTGEGWQLWFDRAVAAQFDWPDAYERCRWPLMATGGGFLEFVQECLRTRRFDTAVPNELLEYAYLLRFAGAMQQPLTNPMFYPLLKELAWGPVRGAAKPDDRGCANLSLLAAAAWKSGHLADAAKALKAIDGWPDNVACQRELQVSAGEVFLAVATAAVTDPHFRRADALYRQGQLDAAITELNAASGLDAMAGRLRDFRLSGWQLEQQYRAGGWVALKARPGLPAWMIAEGRAEPTGDGGFRFPRDELRNAVRCGVAVGSRFELEGRIEAGSEVNGPVIEVAFGKLDEAAAPEVRLVPDLIAPPLAPRQADNLGPTGVWTIPLGTQTAYLAPVAGSRQQDGAIMVQAKASPPTAFRFVLWDQDASVWLDGRPILLHKQVTLAAGPAGSLQLGCRYREPDSVTPTVLKGLRLRKLAAPPAGGA